MPEAAQARCRVEPVVCAGTCRRLQMGDFRQHSSLACQRLQVYTAMVQVACPSCSLSARSLEAFGIPGLGEADPGHTWA